MQAKELTQSLLQSQLKIRKKNLNSWISPAKLNLFFRVLHKRSDGYHEIASLFQAVNLCDRLFISLAASDELTCTDPTIACNASNLVAKALAQFRKFHPVPPVQIHIEKKIPIQAGLGGGSGNAATTLWALNQLTCCPLRTEQLIELASQIGSDVPFFLSSGTAYCTGRGEIIEPFSLPQPLTGFIAKPHYGLSTPLVYQSVLISELQKRDPQLFLCSDPQSWFNDLEQPAFRLEPRLAALKNELRKSFENVVMTGSGTAFFCFHGHPKPLEGVTFFPFCSIQRGEGSWY